MVDRNIMNSIHNVSLDTLIFYKRDGHIHSFLEHYEQQEK